MKKIPMRLCVVCREMKPKAELIRVVVDDNGNLVVDRTKKSSGRGAYVCNGKCTELIEKRKSFERALKGASSEEFFDSVRKEVDSE